jgi:hypothetical protein
LSRASANKLGCQAGLRAQGIVERTRNIPSTTKLCGVGAKNVSQLICALFEWEDAAGAGLLKPPRNCSDSVLPLARKMVLGPMSGYITSHSINNAAAQRTVLESEKRHEHRKR